MSYKFFENTKKPLAEILRPVEMSDLIGQENINISLNNLQSLILWGPPGSGKTSLSNIISKNSGIPSINLSAVSSSSSDFKDVFKMSQNSRIILLVDEIHHLNKSQQDIFLPYLENGNIILIGTTTENPSFELRPALLSRCKVIIFNRLSNESLLKIISRAEKIMNKKIPLDDDGKNFLCNLSDGDGRFLLNRIEEIYSLNIDHNISIDELGDIIHKKPMTYDKNNDSHYSLISAFHKSLRGSDPDAALYWFSRMIEGGEDPKYIGRRLIRCASEDIGLADPHALTISLNALESYKILGSPEGELCLAEAIIYVATCPKSNAVYNAYNESRKLARATGSLNPPKHIINAPTKFMKEQGFFEGYIYDHDTKDAFSGQNYFPDGMKRPNLYIPNERGFEREIKKRLEWWNNIRKNKIT